MGVSAGASRMSSWIGFGPGVSVCQVYHGKVCTSKAECDNGMACIDYSGTRTSTSKHCLCLSGYFWVALYSGCTRMDVLSIVDLKAVATTNSVTLSWKENIHRVPMKYDVTWAASGRKEDVGTSTVITGLRSGMTYNFTITAYLEANDLYSRREINVTKTVTTNRHTAACTSATSDTCSNDLQCLAGVDGTSHFCLCDQTRTEGAYFWSQEKGQCLPISILAVQLISMHTTERSVTFGWLADSYEQHVRYELRWGTTTQVLPPYTYTMNGLNPGQQYSVTFVAVLDGNNFYGPREAKTTKVFTTGQQYSVTFLAVLDGNNFYGPREAKTTRVFTTGVDHLLHCNTQNLCRNGLMCVSQAILNGVKLCMCPTGSFWSKQESRCLRMDRLAVRIDKVVVTTTLASFEWSADDHGTRVTYAVRGNDSAGRVQESPVRSSPFTVGGLTSGTEYHFEFQAVLASSGFYPRAVVKTSVTILTESKGYGDSCTANAKVKECPDTMTCLEGQCSCLAHYTYVRVRGTCKPVGSHLQVCSFSEIACQEALQCVMSTSGQSLCQCPKGTFWAGSTNQCADVSLLIVTVDVVNKTTTSVSVRCTATYVENSVKYAIRVRNHESRERDLTLGVPFTINDLVPGKEYDVGVRAYLEADDIYSLREVTTDATIVMKPARPGPISVQDSQLSTNPMALAFGKASGVVAYYVITLTDSPNKPDESKSVKVANNSLTLHLKYDTRYSYTIAAYNPKDEPSVTVGGTFRTAVQQFKEYGESCSVNTNVCKDTMGCIEGKCQCLSDTFYDESQGICMNGEEHLSQCSVEQDQCRSNLNCVPDTSGNALCLCSSGTFWADRSKTCQSVQILAVFIESVRKTSTSVTFTWSTSSYLREVKHTIHWHEGQDQSEKLGGSPTTVYNLIPGKSYNFTFKSYLESDQHYPVIETTKKMELSTRPSRPGSLVLSECQLSSNPMTLVFTKATGLVASYVIVLSSTGNEPNQNQKVFDNRATFDLSYNTRYRYDIHAYNQVGESSIEVASGTFTTGATQLKGFQRACAGGKDECKQTLECINGACLCPSDTFFDTAKGLCRNGEEHLEQCSLQKDQCSRNLQCRTSTSGTNLCLCMSKLFWAENLNACAPVSRLAVIIEGEKTTTTSVKFEWSSHFDHPGVKYVVHWLDSGDRSQEFTKSPFAVNNLTPGKHYDFILIASLEPNEFYPRLETTTGIARSMLPARPGPISVQDSQLSANPMTLTFGKSTGLVAYYVITVSGVGDQQEHSKRTSNSSVSFDLLYDTSYQYSIVAYNQNDQESENARTGNFKTETQQTVDGWNSTCSGQGQGCPEPMVCTKKRCLCRDTAYYQPSQRACRQAEYSVSQSGRKNPDVAIMKGGTVEVHCRFSISHPVPATIAWYFNGRRIDTDHGQTLASTMTRNCELADQETRAQTCKYDALLKISDFTKGLLGDYFIWPHWFGQGGERLCHVNLPEDQFAAPSVTLKPSHLLVKPNSLVTVTCRSTDVNFVAFHDNGKEERNVYVPPTANDVLYSFTAKSPTDLQCFGYLQAGETEIEVARSNIVTVDFISKGELSCPEKLDKHGTNWSVAKASSVVRADCPEGFNGQAVRKCDAQGQWEKANYAYCKRQEIEEVEEKVKVLRGVGPTVQEVEDISSTLRESLAAGEYLLPSDISQSVNILTDVSDVLSSDESDEPLITTAGLEDIADVTNELLSADQDEWDDIGETGNDDEEGDAIGAKLLMALDNLALSSLKDASYTTKPMVRKNVVIKRGRKDPSHDITFPDDSDKLDGELKEWIQGSDNSVFLPSSDLSPSTGQVGYSVVMSKAAKKVKSTGDGDFADKAIQSTVVAVSFNKKTNLSSGVQLKMSVPKKNYSEPRCAFLDIDANTLGTWSDTGCRTEELESGVVQCTCNHLTNFAVLMSPAGSDTSSSHAEALSIITIIGCVISIMCLLALLIVYFLLWRSMKKDRKTYLHLTLSICLLLVYAVFLAGVDGAPDEPNCTMVAAILHYLLLVVFYLMLCEGVEILLAILYVFTSNIPLWYLLAPAFGVPGLIVAITLGATQGENYRSEDVCWLNASSGALWAFVIPAMIVLLVNFVVVGITLRVLMKSLTVKEKDKGDKAKMAIKSVAILSPVLGLTWMFGILAIDDDTVIFQYLFAIFNTLQGLAIFVVYCLLFYQVKDALKVKKRRRASSLAMTGTSFFHSGRKLSSDLTSEKATFSKTHPSDVRLSFGDYETARDISSLQMDKKGNDESIYSEIEDYDTAIKVDNVVARSTARVPQTGTHYSGDPTTTHRASSRFVYDNPVTDVPEAPQGESPYSEIDLQEENNPARDYDYDYPAPLSANNLYLRSFEQ